MKIDLKPFKNPIYVTQPLLPKLSSFEEKLSEIWDEKWLTNNGKQHQLLEKKLEEILRVPNLSLFNNGTIALITACQSLNLTGEVITTPFTFAATPHVLKWNNLNPVFCDIEPEYLNIDANKIESLITPKTTAILAVHVFGNPCDVYEIERIAKKHNLKVIYDGAHAFGIEIPNENAKENSKISIGNFGDITMFSFHATKLFHTAEGGALTFKDKNLKSQIDLLKNFGIKNEEEIVMPGINGKMNEIQAALGLLISDMYLDEQKKRKRLLKVYQNKLRDIPGITLIELDRDVKQSYQYFVIQIDETKFGCSRDYIYEEFKKYNVFTRKYFYPLCSQYNCYKDLPSSSAYKLPIATRVAREVLSMPFYGSLNSEDVNKICNILLQMMPQ